MQVGDFVRAEQLNGQARVLWTPEVQQQWWLSDTPDKLDYDRLARVVRGLEGVVRDLQLSGALNPLLARIGVDALLASAKSNSSRYDFVSRFFAPAHGGTIAA